MRFDAGAERVPTVTPIAKHENSTAEYHTVVSEALNKFGAWFAKTFDFPSTPKLGPKTGRDRLIFH
jgi:hypothetical protein